MWFLQLCLTFLRLSIFGWTNELNAFFPHFALLTPVNHWDFSSDIIASEKSFQKIQAVLHHCLYTLDNTKNFSVPLVPSCFSFGDGCVPQRTYGNVWRHLGGGSQLEGRGCEVLQVCRGQGCYYTPYNTQVSPSTTRNYPAPNVNTTEVEKCCLKQIGNFTFTGVTRCLMPDSPTRL